MREWCTCGCAVECQGCVCLCVWYMGREMKTVVWAGARSWHNVNKRPRITGPSGLDMDSLTLTPSDTHRPCDSVVVWVFWCTHLHLHTCIHIHISGCWVLYSLYSVSVHMDGVHTSRGIVDISIINHSAAINSTRWIHYIHGNYDKGRIGRSVVHPIQVFSVLIIQARFLCTRLI